MIENATLKLFKFYLLVLFWLLSAGNCGNNQQFECKSVRYFIFWDKREVR